MGAIKRRQIAGAVVFQKEEEYGGTVWNSDADRDQRLAPALGHNFN